MCVTLSIFSALRGLVRVFSAQKPLYNPPFAAKVQGVPRVYQIHLDNKTTTNQTKENPTMANKVRLTICGSSYVISTNESEDYMQNLAERLNLDMNELMSSSNSVSITTAAIMTALNYRDELEKASGSADNMRRQIKDYLEDAASAKMAAEELRRENAALRKKVDDLHRRSLTSEA